VYGLGDSARCWYTTLRDYLYQQGCKLSVLDKCTFRLYEDNKLQGILVTHVDDLLFAGTTKFQKIIQGLYRRFKISRAHAGLFTYLGWNVEQVDNAITVDQRLYGTTIKPVPISWERKKQPESNLSSEEKTAYQGVLGKLLWLSGQTRPDLSYDTLELSTLAKDPKVKDLIRINKTLKKIEGGPQKIRFKAINLEREDIKIIYFSDASLGNLPNRVDSARGYLVFISNGRTANLVAWSSQKIKRVAHSAFAAETLSCNDGMAAAIYVRQILSETLYNDPTLRIIPIIGYTDNRQLHDQVTSTKQCQDKRTRLDIAELQEAVKTGEVKEIRWISTTGMLADCLTKRDACSKQLCQVIEEASFG